MVVKSGGKRKVEKVVGEKKIGVGGKNWWMEV